MESNLKTKTQNKKISKAIAIGIAKLNNYSSTKSSHQSFINTLKHLYISRDIRTLNTVTDTLDLLKLKDHTKFYKKFDELTNNVVIKIDKNKIIRDERWKNLDNDTITIVEQLERKIYKPRTTTKNWDTEAPSSNSF